jgi:hypothetical protein
LSSFQPTALTLAKLGTQLINLRGSQGKFGLPPLAIFLVRRKHMPLGFSFGHRLCGKTCCKPVFSRLNTGGINWSNAQNQEEVGSNEKTRWLPHVD